ncbi:D-alanyl-D-alanine endopeptidase [Basilea psittacipulmonis]|uniref:Peptidase S11 D-alanyl-D-alanine carboxypeptidase A N-terminal domain-containing protein n=1 Tax=Basilea psittacipulmonis DSM 24701 TaxID=1072685 RepID=A0A077DC23_9BURK|nr:D-alanyl-D-alanine endopeptidase [Basilea psittacipulmonis]AIL32410.1 hypothetical protein IX83_02960 [Basilea psittacipulmonis DSM 24701]
MKRLLPLSFCLLFSLTNIAHSATTSKKTTTTKRPEMVVQKVANSKTNAIIITRKKPKTTAQALAKKKSSKASLRKVVKKSRSTPTKKVAQVNRPEEDPILTYTTNQHYLYENMPASLQLVANEANLKAKIAYVVDLETGKPLIEKNSDKVQPIASITKLMTALVVLDKDLNLNEKITITKADVDRLKKSSSRLRVGTKITRREALLLSLMSSDNRAAHALARTYPGGKKAFVKAMNQKAKTLGMSRTRFVEPTGLSPKNVSTPKDLVKLLVATDKNPIIRDLSTHDGYNIMMSNGRVQTFHNTNRLIRNNNWDIQVSKTGYIREAGDCLVMKTNFDGKPMAVIILNSQNTSSRFTDAIRLRQLVRNDYPNLY